MYYEIFPLVTIEAFRQKTPVIVRNLGGLPEIVTESGGGFVYDSDQELESAMDKLITNRSMQSELGLRGYDAYLRCWSPDAHLARYFGLIDKIASDRIRAETTT
jgi:glycosyltransferase involved in cell wall biosynthesis